MAIDFKVPISPQGYSDGGALVCGVSAEHAPCRRELMEERGGGGSLHDQPVGHQVQPAAGGGIPPAQAPVWVSWRMDETYIKVKGQWRYLYRAVDKHGQTIDFLLTEHRDTEAALRF